MKISLDLSKIKNSKHPLEKEYFSIIKQIFGEEANIANKYLRENPHTSGYIIVMEIEAPKIKRIDLIIYLLNFYKEVNIKYPNTLLHENNEFLYIVKL